jgi:PiT family inorganic phosphate transporter
VRRLWRASGHGCLLPWSGRACLKAIALVVAGLFAVVAGANDGSALLTTGLRVPGFRPHVAIGLLVAAVVVGPVVLFPTSVASTLTHQLVAFSASKAAAGSLVASAGALVVVFGLARAGLPTSLTVALVGALTGAALGAGVSVNWPTLVKILAVGLVAPGLCALVAFGAARLSWPALSAPALAYRSDVTARLRRWHRATFSLQCLAYSANGGQKMLAVFALALGGGAGRPLRDPLWQAAALAGLFAAGVLTSFRKVASNLGRSVLAVRLRHAVVAEACSSAAVLAAGLTGTPLTLSQSVAGALVGAGSSESPRRVRWAEAARLAGAWAFTFPAAWSLGALGGALARWA